MLPCTHCTLPNIGTKFTTNKKWRLYIYKVLQVIEIDKLLIKFKLLAQFLNQKKKLLTYIIWTHIQDFPYARFWFWFQFHLQQKASFAIWFLCHFHKNNVNLGPSHKNLNLDPLGLILQTREPSNIGKYPMCICEI